MPRIVHGWRLSGPLALVALFAIAAAGSALPPQDATKAPPADKGKAAPKRGLILNTPRALQGYTLFSPLMSSTTYLIDMQGKVVKTWKSEAQGAMSTYLLENGHLLRLAGQRPQLFGDGPGAAGRIQEFTWDGELVWDFKLATTKLLSHHDICRMPNGHVLCIAWEKKSAAEAIANGRRPETVGKGPMLTECILEIEPTGKTTGKVVWEWRVWDHLIQDHDSTKARFGDVGAHPELVDVNFGEGVLASIVAKKEELDKLRAIGYIGSSTPGGKPGPVMADWLHFNAVSYNPEFDQILVNSPENNEFWIIDHGTTTAEAASHEGGRYGKGGDLLYRWGNPRAYRRGTVKDQRLFYQHNTHWIPKGYPGEGHLIVFNNGRHRPGGAHSTVDEIVLPVSADGRYESKPGVAFGPDKAIWSYAAPKKTDLYAEFISGTDRLPNGNTIICSGPTGMFLEVTPDKELVWKYLNPARPETPPNAAAPPPLVEVVPTVLRDGLQLSADEQAKLDQLTKEVEGKLERLLTAEQKKVLHEPPKGMGPGGPPNFGGSLQAVQIVPAPVRTRLKLTDAQKKQLEALVKDTQAKAEGLLTEDHRKEMKETIETFVNAWGGGAGGGGGPPPIANAVYRAYRYATDYPGLAGKELTPGKPIEEIEAAATTTTRSR